MDRRLLQRGMMRRTLTLLGLWVTLGAATGGVAQGQSLRVCVQTLGTRGPTELGPDCTRIEAVPVGIDECAAPAEVTFEVTNIPSTASVLDFWRADGAACNDPLQRDGVDDTCEHLFSVSTDAQLEKLITRPISDLVDCTEGQPSQTVSLFVLAGDSSPERDEVPYGRLIVRVDTERPPAPTNVEGGRGDTAIPVRWSISSGDLFEHRVYVFVGGVSVGAVTDAGIGGGTDAGPLAPIDAGGTGADAGDGIDGGSPDDAGVLGDGGALPMMILPIAHDGGHEDGGTTGGGGIACDTSGAAVGVVPEGIEPVAVVSGSRGGAELNGAALGLGFGESAVVVVTSVDKARNESVTSSAACIQRVETTGFCDAIGGCSDDGCSCSAVGAASARRGEGLAWLGSLVLLGLWALRRRGRRR